MQITFEIDDTIIPSITEYLQTQVTGVSNPITKAQRLVPMYESPEDWLKQQVGNLVAQVVMQHPTAEVQAQLQQAQAIQDAIKAKAMPKKVANPPA